MTSRIAAASATPIRGSSASPMGWWLTAFSIVFVAGFVLLTAADAPFWLPVFLGWLAMVAVESYSRRTRPPSSDAPWSWLAPKLYARTDR
jgi:hypothetical protein